MNLLVIQLNINKMCLNIWFVFLGFFPFYKLKYLCRTAVYFYILFYIGSYIALPISCIWAPFSSTSDQHLSCDFFSLIFSLHRENCVHSVVFSFGSVFVVFSFKCAHYYWMLETARLKKHTLHVVQKGLRWSLVPVGDHSTILNWPLRKFYLPHGQALALS